MAKGTVILPLDAALFRKGERVCCAVSGGADSTAMLLAMVEANGRKDPLGVELSAAHVHHGLRGEEADGDEAFVRELCERLGVPLTVFLVDTTARMEAEGEGLEEAARTLRYAALRGLAVDAIATAHTLDDQAETVVMKLLRGAWTEGLGGIAPELEGKAQSLEPRDSGPRVVRPVLRVRRSEIETFLYAREQGWREDSSNQNVSLTRNKVRHELMPVLRGFNPGLDGVLAGMAEVAREEEAFWAVEVERTLRAVLLPGKPVRGGGRASSTAAGSASGAVEIERLKAMPAALRRRVIRAAIRAAGVRLTAEETAKVLALGGFGGFPGVTGKIGSRLELREGLRVERSARELQWSRESADKGI
ncbi:MAG: tRNA lysidine(34) synthetase TilS [Acidobacteriaceae bacterium]|nr:tRNA lysidine(34) synthetase TilS [Acidobacteriaceae bacterium]